MRNSLGSTSTAARIVVGMRNETGAGEMAADMRTEGS
jgi:hypothetical protein